MAKLVIVTFDLIGGNSNQYKLIHKGLAKLRLRRHLPGGSKRRVRLPHNTVAGKLTGRSSATLRNRLAKQITNLFQQNQLEGRVFIVVGGDWAWAKRVT